MSNECGVIKTMSNKMMINVPVSLRKEGDYWVAYCSALELSSYAETKELAKKRFEEEVTIFIEETTKRGTLEKLLLQLGWRLVKKPVPAYDPPRFNLSSLREKILNPFTEKIAIPI